MNGETKGFLFSIISRDGTEYTNIDNTKENQKADFKIEFLFILNTFSGIFKTALKSFIDFLGFILFF